MNIVLTGKTGSGKTTACLKILDTLELKSSSYGGVLTPVNSDGSREIIDVCTGDKLPFCRNEPFLAGPAVGKYFFNKEAFDFGMKAISQSLDKGNDLTFVDELGPLELSGLGFPGVFPKLNSSEIKNILIIVRSSILDKMAKKFDFPFRIVETTNKTANALAEKITGVLD